MEVYLHIRGREDPEMVDLAATALVRDLIEDADEMVWLEDTDEPLVLELAIDTVGIRHRGHVHRGRCRRVEVKVRFNGVVKSHDFSPAATISRVLKWVTGKQGFDLTEAEAAKHTLALPGADHPLDPRVHVGSLLAAGVCDVLLDLVAKVRFEG